MSIPDELSRAPAWQLARMVREREVSPVELTEQCLRRIEVLDGHIGAFITVAAEQALEAARAAEQQLAAGAPLGPLHGVPIAIKDLNYTKGIRTTQGSALMRDYVPDSDDIPVERIRSAGAVIIGKTNTPEFGWKATTENLLVGPTRNPWDPSRTAGGSSGGSAAAVAAGLTPLANGSDAGGSIRMPASHCGIYGMRPTSGRVATAYTGPGGWRAMSQNGPLTSNVHDAALLLSVLSGPDPRDALAIREPPPDFISSLADPSVRGLRVAWSPDLDHRPVDPEVRRLTSAAAALFGDLGAWVEEATPEVDGDTLVQVFATVLLTDLAQGLSPAINGGGAAFLPPKLVEWVTEASRWPATRYAQHLRELEWHRYRLERFFEHYDLLLTPVLAVPPFPIGQNPSVIDGREVDPDWGFTPFAYPFNLGGQPAASVPCGLTRDGLPVGLQVVAGRGCETTVLRASAAFETAQPWAHQLPPLPTP